MHFATYPPSNMQCQMIRAISNRGSIRPVQKIGPAARRGGPLARKCPTIAGQLGFFPKCLCVRRFVGGDEAFELLVRFAGVPRSGRERAAPETKRWVQIAAAGPIAYGLLREPTFKRGLHTPVRQLIAPRGFSSLLREF